MGSDSLPNLDGLRCFFEEIWSALRGQGVSLDLVGDCGLAMRHLPPAVTVHGRVHDPALLLHSAFLAIAPLRAGFGLKIKLLDYARHGLLTIATPPSLRGFAALAEAPFVIAGTPGIFAAAILRHLISPPPPDESLDYVTRYYGVRRACAGLDLALAHPP